MATRSAANHLAGRVEALAASRADREFANLSTAELREYLQRELTALGFKCAICGNPIISATPADDRSGGRV
jgi:hypothetical protein